MEFLALLPECGGFVTDKDKIKNMWSYYGSKSKIVNHYPPPEFDRVIEPFAGTARYALKYFDRDILLMDKYEVIVDIWNYLKSASRSDIIGLPRPDKGVVLSTIKSLSDIERKFLGYLVAVAQYRPAKKVSKFGYIQMCGEGRKDKLTKIANDLYKIRHWEIIQGDYRDLKNEEATWFIDPPYQHGGDKYVCSDMDYGCLAEWCQSRSGQAIVCENMKADWLPFTPFREMRGIKHTTIEAIWMR